MFLRKDRAPLVVLQARSRRSVAGKDIMLDPRAGIRKAGAMGPLMALLKEVTEVCMAATCWCPVSMHSYAIMTLHWILAKTQSFG